MKLSNLGFKFIGIALVVIALVGGWFVLDLFVFKRNPIHLDAERTFVIKPGASLSRVANDLQREGIIDHPRYLAILGRWHGEADKLKAGEYLLEPGMKPLDILDKVVAGDVIQYSLTVVEGWTFKQMLQAVEADTKLKSTLQGLSNEQIMEKLGAAGKHPEGRFLPETYHFTAGMNDLDFLKRAYDAMSKLLESEWEQRAEGLPYKTPYDALIMASIIEKETGVPDERAEIAGVFVRRLQKHMRLQTDPTVIYGLGESYDGNIRREDLLRDTPYNTYTRHGLTPTPIALPGAAAIHAALHPAADDKLYFVSKGDGSHYFSATLAEHINAVRKYQLNAE
jgi:UPF0755 protein